MRDLGGYAEAVCKLTFCIRDESICRVWCLWDPGATPPKCQGTAADLWTLTLVCAFSSLVQWLPLWPVSQRSLAEARRLGDAPGGTGLSDACQEHEE